MGTSFTRRAIECSSGHGFLCLCRWRRHVRGLGGYQGRRPVVDRAASVGTLHVAGTDASGEALALDSDGGSVCADCRVAGLCCVGRKALSRADLRIIPGVSARDRGSLRRLADAACDHEHLRQQIKHATRKSRLTKKVLTFSQASRVSCDIWQCQFRCWPAEASGTAPWCKLQPPESWSTREF